jgi:type II secretory pathway component PulF
MILCVELSDFRMPIFEYRYQPPTGRAKSATIVADNPRHARDQLREKGIEVDSISSLDGRSRSIVANPSATLGESKRFAPSQSLFERLTQRGHNGSVSWFTREMATLLRVGTPMVDALQLAIDQSHGGFRLVLQDIREHITSGGSLGTAIRRHSHIFEPVLCEMVSVGEQSGALQDVLQQAAEFRERRDRLKDRVLSAMLYPCLVLVLSVAVTLFLMTVVVPTLINSLQELQKELPWPTRILKSASDFLLSYGLYLAVVAIGALVAFGLFLRSPNGRTIWDRFLLRIPIIGTLIVKQNCSRLCMVTATLLKSGVELVRALEIAQGAVMNSAISEVVSVARQRLASGTELGAALRTSTIFPPALIQVFALGQSTGQLEELLFQIANDYDHQVATLSDRATTIVEPLLIVGLSVVVGFILMATLLPILEAGNVLSES